MKKRKILQVVFGILILAIIGYLLYLIGIRLSKYVKQIDPNIIVAVIAGLVTVFGYFITRNSERRKIIEQQIREQKLPVYEQFLDFFFKIIKGTKHNKPISDKEMENFMLDFNKKSIVWLSDKSLKAYVAWRKSAVGYSENKVNNYDETIRQMVLLEQMFFEFRKDIGHKNEELETGDLLSLFINDLDKYKKE